jgi:hypothetical protein
MTAHREGEPGAFFQQPYRLAATALGGVEDARGNIEGADSSVVRCQLPLQFGWQHRKGVVAEVSQPSVNRRRRFAGWREDP